jgi:polar amino acid transport system substrate-binding protein
MMSIFQWTARRATALALLSLLAVGAGAGCGGTTHGHTETGAAPAYDAGLHGLLPARIRTAGVIQVVTDASYAPASSFAPDGHTIVGFEPDLGDALGRVLGVKVRFANADFSSLLGRVASHRADAVMSALTDTPDRERSADFINYFSAGTSIVVQRGNAAGITDLVGLCGHTVAVEKDTTQVDLLARSQKQCGGRSIRVTTADTNADALLQLRTGRAQAVLNDYPPAVALTTDAKTRSQYQLASTTQYEPGLYGIAVAKDDKELRHALELALDRVIRAGAYAEILHRWDVDEGGVPTASINAARIAPAT